MSAEEIAEALVSSCNHGDVATLQQLLSTYPDLDINYATEGGVTLLMHAIIGAGTDVNPSGLYLETCQLLVQYGVHLETADLTYGRTAAHWATYYHRDDILTELIIAGSDMTCPDFSGTSPFHLAIQEEALKCLSQCLRFLPKEILEIPDSQFRLPLHHAVQVGSIEACQLLIAAEANINQPQEVTGLTSLHMAAQLGQGLIIEFLLRQGALLDTPDSSGLTPVHIASVCDSVEGGLGAIVRVVGSGSVLGVTDERGVTPLMQACAFGSEHNIRFLLKKKVDVMAQDAMEGKTCLHWAAGSDTPSAANCVQLIAKKYLNLVETKDNFGRTPLHSCTISGVVETLQVLIANGCDIGSVDLNGKTAVHWATENGNYAILPALLESGCPLDAADANGATPIHYAVQHTGEPTVDELDPEVYEQALNQCKNVQACAAILMGKGAKVNLADQQGMQPLHYAMQFPNNLQVCSAVLTQGVDPNAKDNLGMTAFHIAAQRGIAENCQFLLEHTGGLHGNDVDAQGQTALHHAVTGGGLACLEYLLSCELSIDQSDSEMRTASHVAATVGSLECLQLLATYGANFSLKSIHGALPMHEAAANGHTDALSYLLSSGSPVNDPAGESQATALHYAVAGGHKDCVKILVDNGASINAIATNEENERLTALDYCPEDNVEIAELLKSLGGVSGEEEIKKEEDSEQTKDEMDEPRVDDVIDEPEMGVIESETREENASEFKVETPEPDSVSVRSIRPHTPTRPSPDKGPDFEIEQSPSRPTITPPPSSPRKANIIQRALSVLKREKKTDTILSSTVGLYAAHATMLAAAMIGTPLGEKAIEIAHRVATDTAEELKKAAESYEGQDLPDLVWLREEVVPTPSPPPPVTEPTPTPPPPTPPPVEIKEDPYERRLRKARAQLDQRKSPGYLAVEELVKAQHTHMRLKRQFQQDKLEDDLQEMREEFRREEQRAKQASEKVLKRLADRMSNAQAVSMQMNESIDAQLQEAHDENTKLSTIMADMGVSPRPTVSQWLQQKTIQKKSYLQDALINWDRTKEERNTAILLQQAITSQRALKHAAWGAKKDISARIKALREVYDPSTNMSVKPLPSSSVDKMRSTASTKGLKMPTSNKSRRQGHRVAPTSIKERSKVTSPRAKATPTSSMGSVRATPSGFFNIRDTSPTQGRKATPPGNEQIWYLSKDYADGKTTSFKMPRPPTQSYVRATGPKTVHAERTLHFLSPDEYKALKKEQRSTEKELTQQYGMNSMTSEQGQRPQGRTTVSIVSMDFDKKRPTKNRASYSDPQYHSLASSVGGRGQLSRKQPHSPVDVPILPMTVLDSDPLPRAVAT